MPRPTPATRKRFAQADKEALITLALYAGYFIWWYAFAYGLGSGDPAAYTYVWGFPAWFFYSCILGYPVLTLALWLVIRLYFREVDLAAHTNPDGAAAASPTPPVSDTPDHLSGPAI